MKRAAALGYNISDFSFFCKLKADFLHVRKQLLQKRLDFFPAVCYNKSRRCSIQNETQGVL
jgi:hypothetical protein